MQQQIENWGRAVLQIDTLANMFSYEILVYEGQNPYWIPVQNVLLPFLKEEFQRGDQLTIFASVIGGAPGRLVMTINEYNQE